MNDESDFAHLPKIEEELRRITNFAFTIGSTISNLSEEEKILKETTMNHFFEVSFKMIKDLHAKFPDQDLMNLFAIMFSSLLQTAETMKMANTLRENISERERDRIQSN